MLITVVIENLPNGDLRAVAPDLPGCTLTGPDDGNALARMRLAIEGALADLLLDGKPIPVVMSAASWRLDPRFRTSRCYEVHMNLGHIEAVGRHQRDRRNETPAAPSGLAAQAPDQA